MPNIFVCLIAFALSFFAFVVLDSSYAAIKLRIGQWKWEWERRKDGGGMKKIFCPKCKSKIGEALDDAQGNGYIYLCKGSKNDKHTIKWTVAISPEGKFDFEQFNDNSALEARTAN